MTWHGVVVCIHRFFLVSLRPNHGPYDCNLSSIKTRLPSLISNDVNCPVCIHKVARPTNAGSRGKKHGSMTLKVTHIEKHDIPAAVRLHLRAFANFPLLNAIYPSAAQSSIWLDHMYHAMDTAHADSCQNLLKVSSPEDGHLMGIAEWERCSGASIDHKPSPARPLPEGGNVEVHAAHNKERSEKRATIVGDRQYHCESHDAFTP